MACARRLLLLLLLLLLLPLVTVPWLGVGADGDDEDDGFEMGWGGAGGVGYEWVASSNVNRVDRGQQQVVCPCLACNQQRKADNYNSLKHYISS